MLKGGFIIRRQILPNFSFGDKEFDTLEKLIKYHYTSRVPMGDDSGDKKIGGHVHV